MSCCRVLFGLTLVIRTAFHLLIAGYAAMDLKDIYDQTSGTFKQLALKLTHANEVVIGTAGAASESMWSLFYEVVPEVDPDDVVVAISTSEFEFPLGFYVFCGVALFVLSCVYPWRGSSRSSLTVYAILHALYVGIVIYVVFIRTIIDMSFLRDAYRVMSLPGLFPASLALDVLTFIAAVATSGKGDSVGSYVSIFPLHRVMVLSPSSPRGVASVSTLPPYTQFQNECAPRQQNMA